MKLIKNIEKDKYKHSDHGIRLDSHETFSLTNGSVFSTNVIIFGVDMNSSALVENNTRDSQVLNEKAWCISRVK